MKTTLKRPCKLTPKMRAFTLAYHKTGQPVVSYKQAYATHANDKVCAVEASRLLAKKPVQTLLASLREKTEACTVLSAAQVLDRLTRIAEQKTLFARDRIKALELLGRYRKLFTDRVELKAPDGQALVIASLSERLREARTRSKLKTDRIPSAQHEE